jgi:DNA modification methylase
MSGGSLDKFRCETIGPHRLYLGDCLEVMYLLDSASADAVITDPPYCSGAATEAGKGSATHQGLRSETIRSGRFSWFSADNMTTSGLVWLLRSLSVEAARIVKESGSLMAFCDWRMVTSLAPAMESAGWRQRNLCLWDKGHFGCGTGFRPQHEMIMHLTKRAPIFYHVGYGNVLTCPRVSGDDKEHATEKPIGLMSALVEVTTPRGGLVIDPFMGSASTGVAAIRLGRRFIGVEVSPANFEIACRRISEAMKRPDLFIEQRHEKQVQTAISFEGGAA